MKPLRERDVWSVALLVMWILLAGLVLGSMISALLGRAGLPFSMEHRHEPAFELGPWRCQRSPDQYLEGHLEAAPREPRLGAVWHCVAGWTEPDAGGRRFWREKFLEEPWAQRRCRCGHPDP